MKLLKLAIICTLILLFTGCVTVENKTKNTSFLGRGINLGNYLEAPRDYNNDGIYDYDDGEGSWSGGRKVLKDDIARIKQAGFDHIRIPVRWSDYFSITTPYILDGEPGLNRVNRVKEVISWAFENNLKVVMNIHHYTQMMDGTLLSEDEHRERVKAIWQFLANEFNTTEYPTDKLIFELLNEPHTNVGYTAWNMIIHELTPIIWKKANDRKIMIGTANWGGVPGLNMLQLPDECNNSNTIITIHYYEPFKFSHQGASWVANSSDWIGTRWKGTNSEKQHLISLFNDIDNWNTDNYEIYIGEFGIYSKYSNPKDQGLWTSFIVNQSNQRGYSWAYWEYSEGFGAFDKEKMEWRPQLINALIPEFSN